MSWNHKVCKQNENIHLHSFVVEFYCVIEFIYINTFAINTLIQKNLEKVKNK